MAGTLHQGIVLRQDVVGAVTVDYTAVRGFQCVDIAVQSDAAPGGGEGVTCQRGASALSALIVADAQDALTRAASLIGSQSTFTVGDIFRVVGSNAGVDADVFLFAVSIPGLAG